MTDTPMEIPPDRSLFGDDAQFQHRPPSRGMLIRNAYPHLSDTEYEKMLARGREIRRQEAARATELRKMKRGLGRARGEARPKSWVLPRSHYPHLTNAEYDDLLDRLEIAEQRL